jgi:hypothetical protein
MGKQQTQLTQFFDGKRRECELRDFHVLKNPAGERRVQLSMHMPLSGQPMDGIPEEFVEQFILMEKETSALNLAKHEGVVEGATLSVFATDTIKSPILTSNGVMLQGFRLVGEGVKDKRAVHLEFMVYVPYSIALRDWGCDTLHSTFWIEVEASQMEIVTEAPAEQKQPVLVQ